MSPGNQHCVKVNQRTKDGKRDFESQNYGREMRKFKTSFILMNDEKKLKLQFQLHLPQVLLEPLRDACVCPSLPPARLLSRFAIEEV